MQVELSGLMLSSVILIHSNSEINPCLQSFLNKSLQVSHKLFSWTVDTTQNHNMATVMVVVVVVERMLQSLSLHCGSHFGYLPPLLTINSQKGDIFHVARTGQAILHYPVDLTNFSFTISNSHQECLSTR